MPLSPGKWITKIILAVILGEAIWGLLVSLTNGLIVPALARVIVGDPQSPVYLGKGDFNLTGIFISIVELCLAGIVAILLNQWSRSGPAGTRVRTIKVRTVAGKTTLPSIAPSSIAPSPSVPKTSPTALEPAPVAPGAAVAVQLTPMKAPSSTAAAPDSLPAPPKSATPGAKPVAQVNPSKTKKPTEVYYNLVGEPINPTEDDE